jgi:hypothetical protein
MRLDRSLGDVQIFSDFRVVTPLKKQIDDLPFPGSYLAEVLFHKHLHLADPTRPLQVAEQPDPSAHLDSGLYDSFCIHTAKSGCRC